MMKQQFADKRLWFAIIIYGAITGCLSIRHTMWRDELQLWLYGYKSSDFAEFLSNRKAEIHPIGYQAFTYLVSRFFSNPEILKLTNWIFTILMAVVVLFFTQIKKPLRVVFLFGLIPLIGYSNIAEQYMPATLGFILLLNLYVNSRNRALFFVVAGVIANLHILFLIASIGFVGIYIIESFVAQKKLIDVFRLNRKLFFFTGVYFTSTIFALSMISRTTASGKITGLTDFPQLIKRSLIVIGSACFPFMNFDLGVNNRPLVTLLLIALGLLVLFGLFYTALKQDLKMGFAIVLSNSLLIAAMVIGYSSYWWHFGVLFLSLFLSFVVLTQRVPKDQFSRFTHKFLFGLLLISQTTALFVGSNTDLWERQPYSTAEQTASFLTEYCKGDCTIVMNSQSLGASISAYMDGREIYYSDISRYGSFAIWDLPVRDVAWDDLVTDAKNLRNPIFVTSGLENPPSNIRLIRSFSDAIWEDENFTISEPSE
jgi:hypothetical protein